MAHFPSVIEIRRQVHKLREPLSAFIIHVELLDNEPLSAMARRYLKTMREEMDRASAALDEIDFVLENGHSSSNEAATRSSNHEAATRPHSG